MLHNPYFSVLFSVLVQCFDWLVHSSNHKHRLLLKKLKQPTRENCIRYASYIKVYNSVIRQAKINYFNSEIQTAKHDMKKTWAILKEATNTQQTKSPLPDHYVIENKKVTDKKKIVDTFNKFFANIGYNSSEHVPQPTTSFRNYLNQPHYNSTFLDPITPNDIIETVSKCKNKNSHGHDEISTKLVK